MISAKMIYKIGMLFYFFAFAGWIYECLFVFLRDKKLVNRGFLAGPILPLYGFGAVAVSVLLRPVSHIPTLLYFSGMLLATALEYGTGWLLEKCFHTKWWDYSQEPYNFQGRIALIPSMFWGIVCLVMFDFLLPGARAIVGSIPMAAGQVLLGVCLLLTAADLSYTVITMLNLRQQLEKLYAFKQELDELFADATEASRRRLLKYSASELSDRLRRLKRNPWLGSGRILDAFPRMRINFGKSESVSVRELMNGMRERAENFTGMVRERRESWEEQLKSRKISLEEHRKEKK